jgi:hypothetical protein
MINKKTSPFKSVVEFEKELTSFANKYRTIVAEHSKRISDYFEISCYNMIIRYYELNGYTPVVENMIGGKFRFKCSPTGLLGNFSYMSLKKGETTYRLYHNASVQSAHDKDIFTTPDIVVAKDFTPSETMNYYRGKKRFTYIPNVEMITFCEAKHLMPFPELMIGFIGTVNELKPTCMNKVIKRRKKSDHIAPSLMMSGCLSKATSMISESLRRRYYVNIFSDLFMEAYTNYFSTISLPKITTLTTKGIERTREY